LGGDDVPEVDENIAAQTLDPHMGDIDERNERAAYAVMNSASRTRCSVWALKGTHAMQRHTPREWWRNHMQDAFERLLNCACMETRIGLLRQRLRSPSRTDCGGTFPHHV